MFRSSSLLPQKLLLVADPGFPTGCQPIIWPIFPANYMKTKKFWARGGCPLRSPDPPLNLHHGNTFEVSAIFIYFETPFSTFEVEVTK